MGPVVIGVLNKDIDGNHRKRGAGVVLYHGLDAFGVECETKAFDQRVVRCAENGLHRAI